VKKLTKVGGPVTCACGGWPCVIVAVSGRLSV
jgi:hypothetical protein